ncbi:glycoside hydrolase family 18 protein [Rhypophila sp. PSN 637]
MLLPHILGILGGLSEVVLAEQFDMNARLAYTEAVPDVLGLTSRQSEAVEAFAFSDPAVIDAELAEWEERVTTGNQAIPTFGQDPSTWAIYPDVSALKACNKTQLLDLTVFNAVKKEAEGIRACSANSSPSTSKPAKRQEAVKSCIPASEVERKVAGQLETSGSAKEESSVSQALVTAGKQLASYLVKVEPDCDTSALSRFAITGENAVLGVYAGAQAHRQGATAKLLDKVLSHIEANGISEGLTAEICVQGEGRLGADYVVGVAVSTDEDDGLKIAQDAVRHWVNGTCLTSGSSAGSKSWADFSLRVLSEARHTHGLRDCSAVPAPVANSTLPNNSTLLTKRAECRYIRVVQNNGCPEMAAMAGQPVCCSAGSLPDLKPKQNADGSCAAYTTQALDDCSKISATYQITQQEIEEFNKNTWGWSGCEPYVYPNKNTCLSKGSPPMPAPVDNAMCGPQVPNTQRPTNGSDLASLNPCPLNVCCNIWGQCGLTDEFCTEKKSKTGAPGTSGAKDGCVSSCGMEIKKGTPVANDIRIGYFEAWNGNRPCLKSHVTQYKNDGYTHIHWAFANLTEDFQVDVSGLQEEWDMFKSMTGVKKIVSTEAGTWPILKKAVLPANRDKFKNNVVKFVNDNKLDGADFDWEYPAAPDIPGVPAGDLQEGVNYARFLAAMRTALPKEKSVSFAAPASYWYLKQFPISTMAKTVDYIVYMTYDFTYVGNEWATPGCKTGNCLRSHVNATETLLSLAMITKAGVDPNKVIVGVTSYGRSFHMAQKGCDGPQCLYTGDRLNSQAAKGACTDTAGYISNAEIEEIIAKGGNIKTWTQNATDYLVYNDLEWVSYMSDINKAARMILYHSYGFGGTTDWAIDLQSFKGDATYDNSGDVDIEPWKPCDKTYGSLDDVERDSGSIPDHCMPGYILDALAAELEKAIKDYDDIMKTDYDKKFGYFAKAIKQKWDNDLFNFYHDHTDEYFDCLHALPTDKPHVFRNESVKCPPKYFDGHAYNIYLIPKDVEKLTKFLTDKYGIDYEWTRGGVFEFAPCLKDCDEYSKMYGSLELKPDFAVPNPKDSVSKSISNIRSLPDFYRQTSSYIKLGFFDEDPQDAVDGSAIPVFMIQQAVQAMHDIYEAEKEIQKKEMENLIITCLSAILFILPGLGQAMAAVSGIAMIARIATVIAEVGGLATGVYDIATNKDNLALGVFSLLLGFVGVGGALKGKWADAGKMRRDMTPEQIAGMGDIVKNGLGKVAGLSGRVCKA